MAHDDKVTNPTANRPFEDVLQTNLARRKVLQGSLATAAITFFTGASATALAGPKWGTWKKQESLVDFEPVTLADAAAGDGKTPLISPDYEYQVLIPWGQGLEPSCASYDGDPDTRPGPANQLRQIGIGHDGMWYFPIEDDARPRCGWDEDWDDWKDEDGWHKNTDRRFRKGNKQGVLCINHEFGTNVHVLGKGSPESLGDVQASQHAHGVSVVELKKIRGEWRPVDSKRSRRIHVNTPVTFSGPVADSDLLKTPAGNAPKGTVNNCSNGYTPWGTYLTCEENFNGYFGSTDTGEWNSDEDAGPVTATYAQQRYGFENGGFGYGWEKFDDRFDLANPDFKNEENRFGWVVEIDPMDPTQMPVKRTALGRFKHEGAAVTVGKGGRVVLYMGDDQRFDYIYKFVSADDWRKMRREGKSPLDEGKLYVARFNDDGTGDWLELTIDDPAIKNYSEFKFTSQEEVLTYARIAADALGATPMDRPEWTSVAPNGDVYCTLTNNSQRTVADPANPLAPNPDGHIIRWRDSERFTGDSFAWDIYILAEKTHGTEESFSDPDGLWVDPDGRIFIQTDGGQKDGLNNQMVVADTNELVPEFKRLFMGLNSDEITGITVTPDRKTMFINSQHPGNGDPDLTNFPAAPGSGKIPRDCTFAITKKDGGIVGS